MVGESWNIVTTSRLSPCFLFAEVEFPSHEDGRRSDQRRFAAPKKALHCSLHRTRGDGVWSFHPRWCEDCLIKFLSCQLCQSNSVLIRLHGYGYQTKSHETPISGTQKNCMTFLHIRSWLQPPWARGDWTWHSHHCATRWLYGGHSSKECHLS